MVSIMAEKPEKLHKNPPSYKDELDKIEGNTDKDQMGSVAPDISEIGPAVEAVAHDKSFTESPEGTVAPLEKSGEPEFDRGNVNEKFSKEHSFDAETLVTGKKSSGMKAFAETDKPADETPME